MEKTPRIPIPPAVRQYVFERDNYQYKSCGKTNKTVKLQVDHIIPLAKGGTNDISNLQTLCSSCNQQKSDRIDCRFKRHFTQTTED
ncbi:MAG: HNH endonuclease [Cyanobacteria bacterium P01_E01_bin.42]